MLHLKHLNNVPFQFTSMIEGILYQNKFIPNPDAVFHDLHDKVAWDLSIKSRKTASLGVAYNYPPFHYPKTNMLPVLKDICQAIEQQLQFKPNNCLINLYENGQSKMGFHSDQVDLLAATTGVAIISLGQERVLRFRPLENKDRTIDYLLANGSLFYMNQAVQKHWQHAIPKDDTTAPRMSLTFRKIKTT